ncbi:MAG: hypothetical protein HZA61_02250 [Candidatus Eisenbacteria bacterium]|uniref:T9SS type A sorting domain-containing protein n=1 Tax=Eiseniibacteriota bacterium TaxID=2212470 RepID=A0A933SAM2_UNCEI|nr:hypothetical protein [Candidatus Eisenbacteria bacterium]
MRALRLPSLLATAFLCMSGTALAQGAWKQDAFVIGTWMDPTVDPARAVITRRSLETARAGHFNLLTGMHHHFSGWRVTTPPDTATLSWAAAAGLSVALTHNDWYGTSATNPANVPLFDSTLARYAFDPVKSPALGAAAKDALEGWCLWDEPPYDTTGAARVSEFLKGWTRASHLEDAARADGRARMTWINFYNGCGGGYSCYETYLRKYLSDPDPLRRPDVASLTLYPFSGSTTAPTLSNYFYWMRVMRDVMAGRPWWVISLSSEVAAGTGFSRPDDNQLRFMASAPVAAGAKGVVWFTYQFDDGYGYPMTGHVGDLEATVREDFLPTCKYQMLQPINRWLELVVGPVVMKSTHLGLFHQSWQPAFGDPYRPEDYVTSSLPAVTGVCPVTGFDSGNGLDGSTLAAGVWRPDDGSAATYLLVLNKSLVTKSSVVRLRGSFEIAAAPSVIGYEGGMSWTPLGTGTSFPLTLRGGEARLVRLTTSHVPTLALTSPAGGEMWPPGETRTVRWSSEGQPVDIRLYACAADSGREITGPLVFERKGRTGDADTLTMPAIVSRHVRIEIASRGADGVVRRATHGAHIRTALPPAARGSAYTLASANCWMEGDLAMTPWGTPVVGYRSKEGRRMIATFAAGNWTQVEAPDPVYPTAGLSGTNPRLALDAGGKPHMVFTRPYVNDLVEHWQDAAGVWHAWTLDQPHRIREDAPIVAAPDGSFYAAYDGGTAGLVIKRGVAGVWSVFGTPVAATSPRSISLSLDGSGLPWVAFVNRAPGDPDEAIRVLEPVAGGWKERAFTGHFDQVAIEARTGARPQIVYTERIAPHSQLLWHRSVNGVSWPAATLVEPFPLYVRALSAAWWNGSMRIAYAGDGVLKYAELFGGTWTVSALEEANEAGAMVRLAFGPNGERWVAYHDLSLDALRVLGPGPAVAGADCTGCPAPGGNSVRAVRVPNPLHGGEAITFDLQVGVRAPFEATLFDVAGRRVAVREFGALSPGTHLLEWRPRSLQPGAYFLRMALGDGAPATRRLVLLR